MEERKRIERQHYERKARQWAAEDRELAMLGSGATRPILRRPYLAFETLARRLAPRGGLVVDLGAGTGLFSLAAGRESTKVATDISWNALALARVRARNAGEELFLVCADTECLPFRDGSVDLITSAGALYCFDFQRLSREVRRLLRPTGAWLVVDSFDHNIIYRANRLLGWLRGTRTKGALTNIPSSRTLDALHEAFDRVAVSYYGILSFIGPILAGLIGEARAARWLDRADELLAGRFGHLAFKIVFTAQDPVPIRESASVVVGASKRISETARINS